MARSAIPPALAELQNPTSLEAQLEALRQLKNEIVGHEQRKEQAVLNGVVAPLARILATSSKSSGKRRSREVNGGASTGSGNSAAEKDWVWTNEDEMRSQATVIVGSLALGGPAYVAPLLAESILLHLLHALSPTDTPSKLILATLSALVTIADAVLLDQSKFNSVHNTPSRGLISDHIYSKSSVTNIAAILAQDTESPIVLQQVILTAQLVSKTCHEEQHRAALVKVGALDLLAGHLAAIANAGGCGHAPTDPSSPSLPAALPESSLPDVLDAISCIIQHSHYRVARFLYSPNLTGVFPIPKVDGGTGSWHRTTETNFSLGGDQASSQALQAGTDFDELLPKLQAVQSKNEHSFSKAFPALGSFNSQADIARMCGFADAQFQPSQRVIGVEEFESPIYAWLIHIARRAQGHDRLVTCRMLTLLKGLSDTYPFDESSKNRERTLAMLIVPLLVRMIEDASTTDKARLQTPSVVAENRIVLEEAPALLAALISQSSPLQKAAVDAGAIKKLCQILKKSFDPAASTTKPLWSPKPSGITAPYDPTLDIPSCSLGRAGLSAEIIHALKCREGALNALAAIADREDPYRKVIIENGAVACITDSLLAYPDSSSASNKEGKAAFLTGLKDGNPVPVLIAACHAARSMSRSVSILRTSLIDYGVAKPILDLLHHPHVDVQIAATEVLCNLLLNFSPMREDLLEAGSMKTLCQHAHSANSQMRLNSLWALKHLVLSATNEIKVRCLEELGTGWLVQAITGELRESAGPGSQPQPTTPIGMGTPNAAGEQVDLLNAIEEPSMDVDEISSASSEEDDDTMTDSIGTLRQRKRLRFTTTAKIRSRLRYIKEEEQNRSLRADRDDLRIQEQALDFIRNLISETKAGAWEMIDHLFSMIGTSRFFEILTSKLRTRPPPTSYVASMRVRRSVDITYQTPINPPEILLSTVFILIHLANGRPAHRSLLISQTGLLRHVLPLFAHQDRRLRVACVWLVNNLTWVEDSGDAILARSRALELRNLGIEEKIRQCLNDSDLDTRERAKTAAEQMGKLLEGVPGLGQTPGTGGTTGVGLGQSHRWRGEL